MSVNMNSCRGKEVQASVAAQKIPLPSEQCVDCDDMAPSWISPELQPMEGQNQTNLRESDGSQHDDSYFISFPSRSSVISESDSKKLDAYEGNEIENKDYAKSKSNNIVYHGFSFGRRSLSVDHTKSWTFGFSRDNLSIGSIEDEDTEEPDVTDIYRSTGDIPGALLYKTERERRALSQKIGSIGRAGQNISLGHILGRAEDDSMLIPSRLKVAETSFILDETSPIQTDIKWCQPDNSSQFQQLVYEVEFCDITPQTCKAEEFKWYSVSRVYHPVIRVYRTESSLFVGRHRLKQTDKDTIFKLRVRAVGRLMGKTGPVQMWMGRSRSGHELSHSLAGEWSSEIYLTWVGRDNQGQTIQLTSL